LNKMPDPSVSVLMPVHNGGSYLKEAIESILNQTYIDFEFIIINDGSTDGSKEIIKQFYDDRIVYIENDTNKGLIESLNKGIDAARGNFIARMDSDDIALPIRLEAQVRYMNEHPETAVLASRIIFIDESGKETGDWPLDGETTDEKSIKKAMVKENCIAHPSVMVKGKLLKELKYDKRQKNVEDYDLWLRMLNHGLIINKISAPLLLYRRHTNSVTWTQLKKKNFFFRHAKMKEQFLLRELRQGHINGFTLRTIASLISDIIKGTGKEIKNKLKR
jgi:glycosyltransferase involved in cell wall biosynthesis